MDLMKLMMIVIMGTALNPVDSLTSKCKPMQADVCKELNNEYNNTLFPNDFFTSQARSLQQFNSFDSLVKSKCSPVLTKFLCTYHFPPCSSQFMEHVWPCQTLCEMARRDCEPVLKRYGHVWPNYLNCSKFPTQQPCVNTTQPSSATPKPTPTTTTAGAVSTSTATPIPSPATITPIVPLATDKKCVKINSSTCAALHPNYVTYFPHKNYIYQDLAVLQFNSFQLLFTSNCSSKLKPFLCFSHFPACVESNGYTDLQLIYPCKHLCEEVSKNCLPILENYNLSWPEHLNCDNFPSKTEKFCADSTFLSSMPQPTTTTPSSPTTQPTEVTTTEGCQPVDPRVREICGVVHETFTHTYFPHGGFSNQNQAYDEFVKLVPFIESNCSAELRAFLCYQYFPTCTSKKPNVLINPCRSVCRKAQAGCESCLKKHNVQLPSCDNYKVKGNCLSLSDIRGYLRNAAVDTMSCPVNYTSSTDTPTPTPPGCEDCEIKGLSKKSLANNNYDYVAKARVLTQVVSSEALYYSVSVQEYFHPMSKPANPVSIVHTQSSDDCPCINLKVNKEYLIGGYFKNNNILFLPSNGALIEKWENVNRSRVKELVAKVYS